MGPKALALRVCIIIYVVLFKKGFVLFCWSWPGKLLCTAFWGKAASGKHQHHFGGLHRGIMKRNSLDSSIWKVNDFPILFSVILQEKTSKHMRSFFIGPRRPTIDSRYMKNKESRMKNGLMIVITAYLCRSRDERIQSYHLRVCSRTFKSRHSTMQVVSCNKISTFSFLYFSQLSQEMYQLVSFHQNR